MDYDINPMGKGLLVKRSGPCVVRHRQCMMAAGNIHYRINIQHIHHLSGRTLVINDFCVRLHILLDLFRIPDKYIGALDMELLQGL